SHQERPDPFVEPRAPALETLEANVEPAAAAGKLSSQPRRVADLARRLADAERKLSTAHTEADRRSQRADLGPDRPIERLVHGRIRASPGRRRRPIAPHHGSREARLGSRPPEHARPIRERQFAVGDLAAAEVRAKSRVGPSPAGQAQIPRHVEQQARRAALPGVRHLVANGGGAVVRAIGEGSGGHDSCGTGEQMEAQAERDAIMESGGGREPEVRYRAIARDLVRDRLLHAPQVDRVLEPYSKCAVEIGRKAATHHDATRHRPGDDERGKPCPPERGLRAARGLERPPRGPAGDTRAHAPRIRERRIGEGRERIERAARGACPDTLPFAGRTQTLDTELRVLRDQVAGRQERQAYQRRGLHGFPNWKRWTYVTRSDGRNAGA